MGSCLSRERDDGGAGDDGRRRRPTFIGLGDAEELLKGDGGKLSRWDSGLSAFSEEGGRHVVERPARVGAFNVRRCLKERLIN